MNDEKMLRPGVVSNICAADVSQGIPVDERGTALEIVRRESATGRFDKLLTNEVMVSTLRVVKEEVEKVIREAQADGRLAGDFLVKWTVVAFPDSRKTEAIGVSFVRNE